MPTSSCGARLLAFALCFAISVSLISSVRCLGQSAQSQEMPGLLRDQALHMLSDANDTVKKQYYDEKFHGIDLDSRRQEAEKRIHSSKSFSEALGVVAWDLDALNDSHTFFIPPPRPYDVQKGWEMGFVGDDCYITAVQAGSDAAAKNVKPGDQVLPIEGFY